MDKIKILGLGSPWGDDQAGLKVVELLQKNYIVSPSILIESHDRPGIRLLELIRGANTVYLIDAVKLPITSVGKIHRFQDQEIQEIPSFLSSHDIGIAETLRLGKVLNRLPDTLIFYGIETGDIKTDGSLSVLVAQAVQQLAELIANQVNLSKP